MVTLRDVAKDNYNECLSLDVGEEQHGFVASNLYTLAQAYIYRDVVKLFAVYNEEVPVGFIMLDVDRSRGEYWIWRFMIDRRFQRKGYGSIAMEHIKEYFRSVRAQQVKLSFVPENTGAERFYEQCGFHRNGELHDGETVMAVFI